MAEMLNKECNMSGENIICEQCPFNGENIICPNLLEMLEVVLLPLVAACTW